MKRAIAALAVVFVTTLATADDQVRSAQEKLKSEGFYSGEATGLMGEETVGALKRFQIRNGLEPTSRLDAPTIHALGLDGQGPEAAPQPTSQPTPEAAFPAPSGAVAPEPALSPQYAPSPSAPIRTAPSPTPRMQVGPPVAPEPTGEPEAVGGPENVWIFAGTMYERAPGFVRTDVIRSAQRRLREQGFYGEVADGVAGPATRSALVLYQRRFRLPETGMLDNPTLAKMGLLPRVIPAPAPAWVPRGGTGYPPVPPPPPYLR